MLFLQISTYIYMHISTGINFKYDVGVYPSGVETLIWKLFSVPLLNLPSIWGSTQNEQSAQQSNLIFCASLHFWNIFLHNGSMFYTFHKSSGVICYLSPLNCLRPSQTGLISFLTIPKGPWIILTVGFLSSILYVTGKWSTHGRHYCNSCLNFESFKQQRSIG